MQDVNEADIPPPTFKISWLATLVGKEAAFKLVTNFGGTRVYVARAPNRGDKSTRVCELIGEEAYNKLVEYSGASCYMKIPRAKDWIILYCKSLGLSYAQIAVKLFTTEGTVHRILKENDLTRHPGITDTARAATRSAVAHEEKSS